MFPYCPAWVLSWHYRKQVLLMELRRYNADILCLQARLASHVDSAVQTLTKCMLLKRSALGVFATVRRHPKLLVWS